MRRSSKHRPSRPALEGAAKPLSARAVAQALTKTLLRAALTDPAAECVDHISRPRRFAGTRWRHIPARDLVEDLSSKDLHGNIVAEVKLIVSYLLHMSDIS